MKNIKLKNIKITTKKNSTENTESEQNKNFTGTRNKREVKKCNRIKQEEPARLTTEQANDG